VTIRENREEKAAMVREDKLSNKEFESLVAKARWSFRVDQRA
jgi:hypothetical protein